MIAASVVRRAPSWGRVVGRPAPDVPLPDRDPEAFSPLFVLISLSPNGYFRFCLGIRIARLTTPAPLSDGAHLKWRKFQ